MFGLFRFKIIKFSLLNYHRNHILCFNTISCDNITCGKDMRNAIVFLVIITVAYLTPDSQAKVLAKCDIVDALNRHRFPRSFLSSCMYYRNILRKNLLNNKYWGIGRCFYLGLCLIQAESGGDTRKVTTTSLSSKYGIFQIDSKEWCGKGYIGGLCNVDCEGKTSSNKLVYNCI